MATGGGLKLFGWFVGRVIVAIWPDLLVEGTRQAEYNS